MRLRCPKDGQCTGCRELQFQSLWELAGKTYWDPQAPPRPVTRRRTPAAGMGTSTAISTAPDREMAVRRAADVPVGRFRWTRLWPLQACSMEIGTPTTRARDVIPLRSQAGFPLPEFGAEHLPVERRLAGIVLFFVATLMVGIDHSFSVDWPGCERRECGPVYGTLNAKGIFAGLPATGASQCPGSPSPSLNGAAWAGRVNAIPSLACFFSLGGLPDGTGSAIRLILPPVMERAGRPSCRFRRRRFRGALKEPPTPRR